MILLTLGQGSLIASPIMMFIFGISFKYSSKRSSFSITVSFFTLGAIIFVRMPLPGPISKQISFFVRLDASINLFITVSLTRKC